jgi:hypothetical protein
MTDQLIWFCFLLRLTSTDWLVFYCDWMTDWLTWFWFLLRLTSTDWLGSAVYCDWLLLTDLSSTGICLLLWLTDWLTWFWFLLRLTSTDWLGSAFYCDWLLLTDFSSTVIYLLLWLNDLVLLSAATHFLFTTGFSSSLSSPVLRSAFVFYWFLTSILRLTSPDSVLIRTVTHIAYRYPRNCFLITRFHGNACWFHSDMLISKNLQLSFLYPTKHLFNTERWFVSKNRISAEKALVNSFSSNGPHSLTHGAEPFLRRCQLCSYSRTSQHFVEPESSLPRSQEPSTGPSPEPYQFNPYHPILSL